MGIKGKRYMLEPAVSEDCPLQRWIKSLQEAGKTTREDTMSLLYGRLYLNVNNFLTNLHK